MKTYLDMDEILRHCRRYIGQEYDDPYLVSAVPEEVIRHLPPADVVEVRHGQKIEIATVEDWFPWCKCSVCGYDGLFLEDDYCSHCGAKLDGGQDK